MNQTEQDNNSIDNKKEDDLLELELDLDLDLDDSEDFNQMLEDTMPSGQGFKLSAGQTVTGNIMKISREVAFVNLGGKSEGQVNLEELLDEEGKLPYSIGDSVELFVLTPSSRDGIAILSRKLAKGKAAREFIQDAYSNRIPMEGKVAQVIKGGLEINLSGFKAFCPISQIQLHYCEDPDIHLGQNYAFRITRMEGDMKNIVVSRRLILEEEEKKKASQLRMDLKKGDHIKGKVVSIRPFGAFIDLGGLQGLLHVSQMSFSRVENPEEIVTVGQEIEVEILEFDVESDRISLGLKQLMQDPWEMAAERYLPGDTVEGTVVRITNFGVFVELEPGVDGLLHISETSIMAREKLRHPSDFFNQGQKIEVQIGEVYDGQKRISLRAPLQNDGATPIEVGNLVQVTVEKVVDFGVFVRIPPRSSGLIHKSEMNLQDGQDHKKVFCPGTALDAKILAIGEDQKIKLSLSTGSEQKQEDDQVAKYQKKGEDTQSMGSFGDLLKKKKL